MAKNKKDENPQTISNVEETLSRTEHFLEENYKSLLIGLGVVVAIVGLIWLGRLYLNNRNKEAQSQMYQAERYLEMDSLNLALNGDGNYLGFLDIARQYKFTKAGNLAKYSAGICYLHLGKYEDAIDFLGKYKKKERSSVRLQSEQQAMHTWKRAMLKRVLQNTLKPQIIPITHSAHRSS
jgi:tetratricopeptide (TPR) repeat protein